MLRLLIVNALILMGCLFSAPSFADEVFDRVIKSGTIRCGYVLWPPQLVQNPDTKEMSGASFDIMQEIGRRLSLKVEWTEEAGMDVILQGMQTGRYDMVCFPLIASSARARAAFFTVPLYYSPVYLAVREDDRRFDKDFNRLNDPQYRVASLEGEITAILAEQRFPRATKHSIPQIQGYSFVMKDVGMGKADATIADPTSITLYNKSNTEKLRLLQPPLNVSKITYPIAQDPALKEMLDATISELVLEGWVDNLLQTKYPDYWDSLLPVAKPYGLKE